jgi:ribosome maturation factor RimP
MIQAAFIRELLQEELLKRDLFLVEVSVRPGNRIMVFIDSMQGVTVESCIAISRFIESSLNRDTEDFELEVSSPGLDNPLILPVQYQKNMGRDLDILRKDGIKITGKLIYADGDRIRIEKEVLEKDANGRKKMKVLKEFELRMEEIKTSKVVISIKK